MPESDANLVPRAFQQAHAAKIFHHCSVCLHKTIPCRRAEIQRSQASFTAIHVRKAKASPVCENTRVTPGWGGKKKKNYRTYLSHDLIFLSCDATVKWHKAHFSESMSVSGSNHEITTKRHYLHLNLLLTMLSRARTAILKTNIVQKDVNY